MVKRKVKTDASSHKAAESLNSLYAASAKNARRTGRQSEHSWTAVAADLKFNVGYIYRVANGQKQASNRLLHALGLPMRTMPAPVCPVHGIPHVTKRCPRPRPTFEQNCAGRDAWLAANAERLGGVVAWAEGKT